jgi:hypothetical protein
VGSPLGHAKIGHLDHPAQGGPIRFQRIYRHFPRLHYTFIGPARMEYPPTQTQQPVTGVDVQDPSQPGRYQLSRLPNTWGQQNSRRALLLPNPEPTRKCIRTLLEDGKRLEQPTRMCHNLNLTCGVQGQSIQCTLDPNKDLLGTQPPVGNFNILT